MPRTKPIAIGVTLLWLVTMSAQPCMSQLPASRNLTPKAATTLVVFTGEICNETKSAASQTTAADN